MKTWLPLVLLMAATFCATDGAGAQEVRYDLTGTYGNTTPTTSLTAPGTKFTFEFLVPESVKVLGELDGYSVHVPFLSGSYTFHGIATPISSGAYDWSLAYGYGSVSTIDFNTAAGAIKLGIPDGGGSPLIPFPSFHPPPYLSYQSHFLTGSLPSPTIDIDFTPTGGDPFTAFPATPVSVVGTPVPVPEPSCLTLAAVGLISWGGFALARRRRG